MALPRLEHVWNAFNILKGGDKTNACYLLRDSVSRSGGDLSYIDRVT
jgi:hypothetical protein